MKTLPPVHRIALLFKGSKIYGIIAGISWMPICSTPRACVARQPWAITRS